MTAPDPEHVKPIRVYGNGFLWPWESSSKCPHCGHDPEKDGDESLLNVLIWLITALLICTFIWWVCMLLNWSYTYTLCPTYWQFLKSIIIKICTNLY